MVPSPIAKLRLFLAESCGNTAIEYALIGAVVAISIIGTLLSFGSAGDGLWQNTGNTIADGLRGGDGSGS